MKMAKYLDKSKVLEKGIKALHRELGPVEARRFLTMANYRPMESVAQHRKWQKNLDEDTFIKEIMKEYK